MGRKDEKELYQTLSDTERLLKGLDPSGEKYSLESILAEFGSGAKADAPAAADGAPRSEPAETEPEAEPKTEPEKEPEKEPETEPEQEPETPPAEEPETEPEAPPAEEPSAPPRLRLIRTGRGERQEPFAAPEEREAEREDAEDASQPVSFENLVASTVGAVMEEAEEHRRGAKRRGRLAALLEMRRGAKRSRAAAEAAEDAEPEDPEEAEAESWAQEAEPPAPELLNVYRGRCAALLRRFRLALIPSALALLLMAAGQWSLLPASVTERLQLLLLLGLELVTCVLAAPVFIRAVGALRERSFTPELMAAACCAAAALDSLGALLSDRARAGLPLPGVACLAVCFALWGEMLSLRALRDSFRVLAVGEPNYTVAETEAGIRKQKGSSAGFYHCATASDAASRWQSVLLPLLFVATVVFAVLSTVGRGQGGDFFWCWSLLLTAACSFAFPLCYALPYARIAKRLQKCGVCVAGYLGARFISRSRKMIITDRDLFPEGTIHLNGIKVYGEEIGKVVSYAASLARASGSGISTLFDGLLQSEGGLPQQVDEFAFAKEGGLSGIIHGETTLLGTEKFVRRASVQLPQELKLKGGMFLAVDGKLVAAFAVKYPVIETVDWALHSFRRNRIAPVLASRDPNITPALLKRKFDTDARALYPELGERLELSDPAREEKGKLGAALYREGLMPYAEAVIASRRLCRAVRTLNILTLLGSVSGILLCFYLSFAGAAEMLTPFSVACYQLLWALAAGLVGIDTDRY